MLTLAIFIVMWYNHVKIRYINKLVLTVKFRYLCGLVNEKGGFEEMLITLEIKIEAKRGIIK